MDDESAEMTLADVGRQLRMSAEEVDQLVDLGFLRPRRFLNGLEIFLRSDVEQVSPHQIVVARQQLELLKKQSG